MKQLTFSLRLTDPRPPVLTDLASSLGSPPCEWDTVSTSSKHTCFQSLISAYTRSREATLTTPLPVTEATTRVQEKGSIFKLVFICQVVKIPSTAFTEQVALTETQQSWLLRYQRLPCHGSSECSLPEQSPQAQAPHSATAAAGAGQVVHRGCKPKQGEEINADSTSGVQKGNVRPTELLLTATSLK